MLALAGELFTFKQAQEGRMKNIALMLVAFLVLGLAGCEDKIQGTWIENKGRVLTINTPEGTRILAYDKDGNLIINEIRKPPIVTTTHVPMAPASTTVVRNVPAVRPVQSVPRSSTVYVAARPAHCRPCKDGYSHAPRDGFPCGCGR